MMNEFDIQFFSPGLPAQGMAARARFTATHLEIDGHDVDAPLESMGVTLGGFDHKQLYLFWHEEDGRCAITPKDEVSRSVLISSAPAPLNALLKNASRDIRRHGHRFRGVLAILALVLLLPFLIAGVFLWQSDRIADWVVDHISIEQEKILGEQAFRHATSGMKLRQAGSDWQAINAIGQRLVQGSRYAYHWYVAENPAINAFAVPGGYVVVNTGLIKAADSAEEVAGVLAHEVQHVERRHTLKNMIHTLSWRAVLTLALGDFSGGMIASAAASLGELKYSRDLESEADLEGLHALKRAGIAPNGMISFFNKLAKQDGNSIPLLSTHPASVDRMTTLDATVRQNGAWPATPLPYNWPSIKRSLP